MNILVNSGYFWKIDLCQDNTFMTGGPLGQNIFVPEQFHAHWGSSAGIGSEHTVNRDNYSGELHIVFWNKSECTSFANAVTHPNGIAVLGVFLKIGKVNEEFEKIIPFLGLIKHKTDQVTLPEKVNLEQLLPRLKSFWSYRGSLTTPPYHETVNWIVFKMPIEMSAKQLQQFRKLRSHEAKFIIPFGCNGEQRNNFRKPLPLAGRKIVEYNE